MTTGPWGRRRVTLKRLDDITEFPSIYWKDNKDEPLAKQVKRWLGDTFRKFDEY